MSTAKAVIQELRQMAEGRYFATHRSSLQAAAETLERVSAQLDEWQTTFPDRTAAEIALTFATADWCIRANGKLMAENEVLREQKTLTGAQKDWALSEGLRGGHDHACSCGGSLGQHVTGYCGCLREMTATPRPLQDDKWEVAGRVITGTSLREQRMYHQHPCGCWSRAKGGSTNSIEA